MKNRTRSGFFKAVSTFTLSVFLFQQILWANPEVLTLPEQEIASTLAINDEEIVPLASQESAGSQDDGTNNSTDFLQQTLALEKPDPLANTPSLDYGHEKYSFEEAMDLIRPEFAAAIPVDRITVENLRKLRDLPVEVAFVSVKGIKFLISSGLANEIQGDREVKELLAETDFFAHLHPGEDGEAEPSPQDLFAAGDREEYLLTQREIVGYSKKGILETNIGNEIFLNRWDEAAEKGMEEETRARAWANRLIQAMDRLNQELALSDLENLRASGTVAPDPTLTVSNLTSFSGSPWTLLMTGSSPDTSIIQQSNTQFQINYDVTQAGAVSGATVSFDNPTTSAVEVGNLSTLTDFVVGAKGPAGSKLRFRVEDSLGAVAEVDLINLSSSMQFYKISKTLLPGIDWTKVKRFIYSIDSTRTSTLTGTLTIQTKTLLYSTTAITNLPNSPYLAVASGANKNTTLVETGSTSFKLNYDVTAGTVSGASIVLDNPGTTAVEFGNLLTQTAFTFGISGPAGGKVRLEIEDSLGAKSSVILAGLATGIQYFTVSKSAFTGLDWTKIKQVSFKVDSTLVSPLTGTIAIQAKTLTFSTTLLTNLPASPQVGILEGSTASTTVGMTSNSSFALNFALAGAGTKSGAVVNFDNASTTTVETQNLSAHSQFVFSAYGVTNGKLRIEMEDLTGAKAAYVITGLSTATQYFVLAKDLFAGIDLAKVKRIIFSIDPTLTTLATGTLTIGARTLFYSNALLTALPAKPNPLVLEGSSAATYLTANSATQMKLHFDVTTAGSFSGMSFSFDDPATAAPETQSLAAGDTLTFGLQGGTSLLTRIKVEIEDINGVKSSQLLPINTLSNYLIIQKSLFTGLDWTKIRRVNFIVDKTMITSSAGYKSYFLVSANNFLYTPTVIPTAGLTSASVSTLPGSPSLFLLPGSSVTTLLSETTGKFNLGYDLTTTGTLSGARISYDRPSTTAVETANLSAVSNLVFGLTAPSNTVRMEMVDLSGTKSSVLLTDIGATEKYFRVYLSSFTGIDKTKIKWIQFVMDPVVTNNAAKTGTLGVATKGLTAPVLSAPVVSPAPASTTEASYTFSGTKGRGTGIVVNGVMTVAPNDATTWSAAINLSLEGENVLQFKETTGAGVLGPSAEVRITRDTVVPTGSVRAVKFTNLTVNGATLELALTAQDSGSGINTFSYAIDGGVFSAPETYVASKTITLPEGTGRRLIEVKFYDKAGKISQVYRDEVNLEAMRALASLDPAAVSRPIQELVRKGLLRTDERGNLLALYDRDLLLEQTTFSQPSFTINAPTHGATLPGLSAEFEIGQGTPALLLETGFVIPDQFVRGVPGRGTAQLVIEDGFFKLKVKNPREEIVDGVPFLVDHEEIVISKLTPTAGKLYELEFNFTLAGLEFFLDEDHRRVTSEPLFVLGGVEADPYFRVDTANVTMHALRIYGNTTKVLTSANVLHELTYARDASGNLTEVRDQVRWSRFETAGLAGITYTTIQKFDSAGRLTSTTDRNGDEIRTSYDPLGRILSVQEVATGRLSTFTYVTDASSNLTLTHTLSYSDGYGNAVNAVTKEDFDATGRRRRLETPAGKIVTYAYSDASPQVTANITESGFAYSVSFVPDERGRYVEGVDRTGRRTIRTYTLFADGSEQVLVRREIPDINTIGNPVTYISTERILTDREGRILEREDSRGRIAQYAYDAQGDIISFQDGWGRITAWTYVKDAVREVRRAVETTSFTDDFGNVIQSFSSREFDRAGNLIAEIDPDGNARVEIYEFYAYNHKPKRRTTYFYKGIGTLNALWSTHAALPSTVTARTEWDETGAVALVSGPEGVETRTVVTRDAKGNRLSDAVTTAYLDGATSVSRAESREFDLHGNVTKEIDFLGSEIRYAYDAFDQLLSVTRHLVADAAGEFNRVTTFYEVLSSVGVLLSRRQNENYRDGFGNSIVASGLQVYDTLGNLTRVIEPTGGAQVVEYEFRPDGRILSQTTYRYQDVTTLEALNSKHSLTPSALKEKTTYDLLGEISRLETFDEKIINFVIERDAAGRMIRRVTRTTWTSEDAVVPPKQVTTQATQEWDADGNLTREALANGDEILHTYGALGSQLTSLRRIKFTGADAGGVERIFEERAAFSEVREASGRLSEQSEKVQGTDSFGNSFESVAIRKYDLFGDEIASIDTSGKGRVTETTRFPWDGIEEVRIYEYDGVSDLADLANRHASSPKLFGRTRFSAIKHGGSAALFGGNFLGEMIETENKDHLITRFERVRRTNGELQSETRRVAIPGEAEKVFVDEFSAEGRPILSTDDQGIVTTSTYAFTGELLSQVETGSGTHRIETAFSMLRYENGVSKVVSRTVQGIDRFGRIVDLASAQEFTTRGELAYEITEDERGRVFGRERDARDRIRKLTTFELEDGRAYAGGGHLTLDLLKPWDRSGARITKQEWDALGNETLNETPEERKVTAIVTNALGRPSEITKQITPLDPAGSVRTSREVFDLRGYLLRYEDGFGSVFEYTRGFDGEALSLMETREAGAWVKTTIYQKVRDAKGRVLSTSESTAEENRQGFDDGTSFPRDWDAPDTGHAIRVGRLDVTPGEVRWTASIFEPSADGHELAGNLTLVGSQNAGIFFFLRYDSPRFYLALKLTKDKLQLIEREDTSETLLQEVTLVSPLAADTNYSFRAALVGRRVLFDLGGAAVLDWTIPGTTDILPSGSLALGVDKAAASFDNLAAVRRFTKGRAFGAAEVLTSRTDQAGVTSYFNQEGDVVRMEDPANETVKTYEIEKYATGTLKHKKETISVTAKNVDGVNVTTTLSTEGHYDVNGRLMSFVDTKGETTAYTYTTAGETASITFPDGRRIEYVYAADSVTGSRTTTEIHYKDGAEESRVVKTHNKEGDLIFLSEHLAADPTREEITYTYEYYPGAERKLKRKNAHHRFIDVTTGALVLQYTTFEERSEEGLITKSRDHQGVEKEYTYREFVQPPGSAPKKRIATIRETHTGDLTMHYYFYRNGDSYAGLGHTAPEYWDLDGDDANPEEADDLDFVLEVRDRGTTDAADDEIRAVHYSGRIEKERIERKILYNLGGMTNPDRESGYVYHFDGALDQIVDYRYDYLYNAATGSLDRQPKRLALTTTYKTDAVNGDPRIDKITDAFTIKNHFYTSTGRLDRVEETNGAFPNRVTTSKYNAIGDIAQVMDFYGRKTFYEYVKNSAGRTIAIFETNDQDLGRVFRMLNQEGETILELDKNGRLKLLDPKPQPTRLGKIITETAYFVTDTNGWLTPWFHQAGSSFAEIMAYFDKNGDGKIEDSDIQVLFDGSGFPTGSTLHRDTTHKLLNRENDIVLSLSPEGILTAYDYGRDIFEAKRQTEWKFYTTSATLGYRRIDLDGFSASASTAWTTLGEKLLKTGSRDYEELATDERAAADASRQSAVAEFLIGLGKIVQASDLVVSKTIRRHNSNGELIEEIEPTGLVRKTDYARDGFGVPTASFVTNSRDGGILHQEFNREGEVIRQRFTSSLIKEYAYEKDSFGNILRILEHTFYPQDPTGAGSLEVREMNLAGEVVKTTDKNGVVTDIVMRENAAGEKEIVRRIHFTDSSGNVIDFTETERLNRYGYTVWRRDRNSREVTIALRYDAMGRVAESVETTDYVTEQGQAVHYDEIFRFNDEGEQVWMRDKNGREVSFEYLKNAFGNTAEVHERELLKTGAVALSVKKLSPLGEALSVTDKNGLTVAYVYDKDALGNVTAAYEIVKLRFDYTGDRQVDDRDLAVLVAAYGLTDVESLKSFDLTGDSRIDEEDANTLTRLREYGTREMAVTRQMNVFGDMLTLIDRNGRKLLYTYEKNTAGNVRKSVETADQFQGSTARYFDRDGRLTGMRDQNGNTVRTSYVLDAKGNILETREEQELAQRSVVSNPVETTFAPDGSRIEKESDGKGLVRESHFDSLGRKIYEKLRTGLGGNLGAGTVSATSDSQNASTHPPSRLTDGVHNRSLPWYSKNKADGLWDTEFVTLDLGGVREIGEVRVDTGTESDTVFVRRFDVSVSADGITWKKVGGMSNLTHQGLMTVSFSVEQARFVKLHGFQAWSNDGTVASVTLNEVEVFGFAYSEQWTTYSTDASGNTTATTTDTLGLLRQEIKDSEGRLTYRKQRKADRILAFEAPIAPAGDARLDTSQSKFGGASAKFDGAGDYLTIPDSDDFNFSGGVFTIDAQIRVNSLATDVVIASQGSDSNNYWKFFIDTAGELRFQVYSGGSIYINVPSSAGTISTGTWHHVAIVQTAPGVTNFKLFKNGTFVGGGEGSGSSPADYTGNFRVGQSAAGTTDEFDGWIDELRVSRGVARWNADFTPPAAEYTEDPDTKLLLHLNGGAYDEQWTTYSTDASGNTTATTDTLGLLREEKRDSQGKFVYLKQRKAGSTTEYDEGPVESILDLDGNVVRSDWHVQRTGADVAVFMGVGTGLSAATEDLTSALPVARVLNASAFPERVTDGKFGALARAAVGTGVTLELAEPGVISSMDTYLHRSQGIRYRIDVSLDGINWYTVADKTPAFYRGLQSDTFAAVKAKYVRLVATGHETGLLEFELDEIRLYPPKDRPVISTVTRTFNIEGDLLTEIQTGGRSESYAYEKDAFENVTRVIETHYKPGTTEMDYVTSRYMDQEILAGDVVHSVSAVGDAKIVRTNSKLGGSSGYFDGSGDYLAIPDHADFDFGTGDFTIDFWVNFETFLGGNHTLLDHNSGSHEALVTYNSNNSTLNLFIAGMPVSRTWNPSLNSWYHLAFVRAGSAVRIFVDGTQLGASQVRTENASAAVGIRIGAAYNTSEFFKGWIDEFRVTKGLGRWTANFIPPDKEYTPDSYTKLLLHMEGAEGSRAFKDAPLQTRTFFSKESQMTAAADRQGRVTRYVYSYDATGNPVGAYSITQRGSDYDIRTEFSGEVRDSFGRVIRQISDAGEITYFNYDLDTFGNIRKAYVRSTEPETVTVTRDLLQSHPGASAGIADWDWTGTQLRQDTRSNYLFDGNTDTSATVNLTGGAVKPLVVDFTGDPHPISVRGDARIDTAQSKMGGSSVFFDGSGDYLSTPDHPDFDLGAGDLTVDFWVNFNSLATYQVLYSHGGGVDGEMHIDWQPDGVNALEVTMFYQHNFSWLPTVNTWYHVAVTREAGRLKAFVNGTELAGVTNTRNVSNAHNVNIGAGVTGANNLNGWMDEFRLSKGVARWTSNFAPPSGEYAVDDKTKLLLHFNGSEGSHDFVDSSWAGTPKAVDLTRVRLMTAASPTQGYRIEVTSDGVNWTTVVDRTTGGLKKEWQDYTVSAQNVQKMRIVPVGDGTFTLYELQVFGDPRQEKNYELVRDYDFRGNITSEENVLYSLWSARPELQFYFPDPQKQGIWGRYKGKTIADWAREEGRLEDPRLHSWAPQLDFVTEDLKQSFDSRRELQRRFTDETSLRDWAQKFGQVYDPRLSAYKMMRMQDMTPASGDSTAPLNLSSTPGVSKTVETLKEFQELSVGKTATATSFSDSSSDPSKALDGNAMTTAWRAAGSVKENAFIVDLWKQNEITEVRVAANSPDYLKSFRVATSLDGVNWKTVSEPSGGTGPKEWIVSIAPSVARYVRIDKIEAATGMGGLPQSDFLSEVRVFGNISYELIKEFDAQGRVIREIKTGGAQAGIVEYNRYANGMVSEIRRFGPKVEERRPVPVVSSLGTVAAVTDGDEATGYTLTWAAGDDPKFFIVKLGPDSNGAPVRVDTARIKLAGSATTGFSYSIEASRDGVNWFTVADKTSGRFDGWQEDHFPPVEALFLRVTGDRDTVEGRSLTINEIEAYESQKAQTPFSVERYNTYGMMTSTDNALMLVWKSDPYLRAIFPNPTAANNVPGSRWYGKTLVQWAQQFGYKHYANLASYSSMGVSEILPGLAQAFDDERALQERFRKTGTKDTDLLQYAREKGYREDQRLFYYAPYPANQETARRHTFETRFDHYGNPSILIARDENGARTWRRFNADGRVEEEKEELELIWEENFGAYRDLLSASSLRNWAENTASKLTEGNYGRALSDYSTYAIGGALTALPVTTFHSYIYDTAGWLKETDESLWQLEGTEQRKNITQYDQDGDETHINNQDGDFYLTLVKDRAGRLVKRSGTGSDELFATDIRGAVVADGSGAVVADGGANGNLTALFLLLMNRLPTPEDLAQEIGVTNRGDYASHARLSITSQSILSSSLSTSAGLLDPLLVPTYGMTAAEISEIGLRAVSLRNEAGAAHASEDALETKHLETLTQRTARKFLGRDPAEEGQVSELTQMTAKLRELNTLSSFENFLKSQYNIDASGLSEHNRRTADVRQMIDQVYYALRVYFGFTQDTSFFNLNSSLFTLLKLLKSDPAFEMKELSAGELDKIKSRLLDLIDEDIHFGSSAISSLVVMLSAAKVLDPNVQVPARSALTIEALFSDILTGVISPEFVGNLQFSAYTLKALAETHGLKLAGLRMNFDELKTLVQAGNNVLVNIEDRHFVVVTSVTAAEVTFTENGIMRTRSAAEFQSKWFGVGLVKDSVLSAPQFQTLNLQSKILKTSDLLKVKGAGWFKKLFKKIVQFFQKVIQAIVRVIQKVIQAVTKAFTLIFGKTIGRALASLITGPLNFIATTFHYVAQGDFKGLMKYWGQAALQIALQVVLFFLPGIGQVIGAALNFLFQGLLAAGKFLLGGFLQIAGGLLSGISSFLGPIGGLLKSFGSSLLNAGSRLFDSARSSFSQGLKDFLKSVKAQSFSFDKLKDNFFNALKDKINPLSPLKPQITTGLGDFDGIGLPGYLARFSSSGSFSTIGQAFTERIALRTGESGLFGLLKKVTETLSFSWLQNKIDKKIESSKMNSFWKSVLSTVASAGIQALSAGVMALASAAIPGIGAALGALGKGLGALGSGLASVGRALATGARYVWNGLKAAGSFLLNGAKAIGSALGRGLSAVGRGIGNALGKSWDATKSFFTNISQKIFGTRNAPVNAPGEIEWGSDGASILDNLKNARITFGENLALAYDGVNPSELLHGQGLNDRLLKLTENVFQANVDGQLTNVHLDRLGVPSVEEIGNLFTDVSSKGLLGLGESISKKITEGLQNNNRISLRQKFIDGFIKTENFQGAIEFTAKIDGPYNRPFEINAFNFSALGEDFSYKSLKYDPFHPDLQPRPDGITFAITNPYTGEITFGSYTFKGPTSLQATVFHELVHQDQVMRAEPIFSSFDRYNLEIDAGANTLLYAERMGLSEEDILDEWNYLINNLYKRDRLR